MSIRDYHYFVMQLKDKGYTYQQIKEALESEHGYIISRQAVNKYINKQNIRKLDVKDLISKEDLEVVIRSSSGLKAYQYLMNNGYNISYHKVLSIRNTSEWDREYMNTICNKAASINNIEAALLHIVALYY